MRATDGNYDVIGHRKREREREITATMSILSAGQDEAKLVI